MKLFSSIILSIVIVIFSGFSQSPTPNGYYESGVEQLSKDDYINAIASFTNAISEKPDYGEAYFQRAIAKQKMSEAFGYQSLELCYDLAQALNLGEKQAIPFIEKYCVSECYKMESAFFEPEVVFCADFSSKILYDLPKDAYNKLVHITKINLFNNKFTEISPDFIDLNLLIDLNLASNRLTEVQKTISYLDNLKYLNLNKNMIDHLPTEFGTLSELKELRLKGNRLVTLPTSFSKLKKLEYLDISMNPLQKLPEDLSGFKNLKTLLLTGTAVGKKEQSRIQKALPNTTIYF